MLPRRIVPAFLLASLTVGLASSATAAPVVDPNVVRALEFGKRTGPAARMLGAGAEAPVLIELDRAVTPALRAELAKAGVRNAPGRSTSFSRFIAANVDRQTLSKLSGLQSVRRVSFVPPRGPLPLDHTTRLMDVATARGAHEGIDRLTGRGMLVADTDSNADVFHPHFFHGDGGYYDWVDVDGDGEFEPGVDAIDLDGDGEAGPQETAILLAAATYDRAGGEIPARALGFDPGIDWVFLDENDNGKRDFGAEAGFDDSVPAFGEPLLVPDDVNANGVVEPGERFVRLGTSKFRKVYTSYSKGWLTETRIYERGVDLSQHQNELTDGNMLGSDASHGTGVLSILLGDVPLSGRRWVGVAPEAEVVLVADLGNDGAQGAAWMLEQKPDVALWEMAPWTGLPLDGTDPYSQLVDESAGQDEVAHACPVGNTGGSRKHAQLALPPGETSRLTFEVPGYLDPMYVQVSLNIRDADGLAVRLLTPGGTEVDLTAQAGNQLEPIPGLVVYPTVQTTSRGTYFVDTILYAYDPSSVPMPDGTWALSIEGHAEQAARLDAYVMDEVSGWGQGVVFPKEVATDTTTIGAPAVADHCIAVGAFTGHPNTPQEPWFRGDDPAGQVRYYSGRGPRIDGEPRLDVVAPDNPFAAAPRIASYYGGAIPDGAFWVFGGTSGAGPHVAGVATLLAQTGIRGDAAREAIRAGAIRDTTTEAEPNAYGAGRLNAAGALGVEPGAGAPSVQIVADPVDAVVGEEVSLRLVVSDPNDGPDEMVSRWDDGYDGSWDTDYEPELVRTVLHEETGSYPYKVRVRNRSGRVAEAVMWLNVGEAPVVQPDAGAADAGDVPDAGGAPPASAAADDSGGGCGCRVGAEPRPGAPPALWALIGLGWLAARRRKLSA